MTPTAPTITGTYIVTVSDAHLGVLDTSYSRNIIRAAQEVRRYKRTLEESGYTTRGANADNSYGLDGTTRKHVWYDYSRQLPWFYPDDMWSYRNQGRWPAGIYATVRMHYTALHLCDNCHEQLCPRGDSYCDENLCAYFK